jgi:hypothetical protein
MMKNQQTLIRLTSMIAILLFSVSCLFSDVLYEATSLNSSTGVLNATSWPSLNDGLVVVDDIVVSENGWIIKNISNYFSPMGSPVADSAFLVVFSKSLGNINPMLYATAVSVSSESIVLTDQDNGETRDAVRIYADSLNVNLSAGEYWIGLSPISDSYMNCWMAWGSRTEHGDVPKCWDMLQNNWVGLAFWIVTDSMMKIEGTAGPTSVDITPTPVSFILNANYPNPFNPSTTISFSLTQSAQTRLEIYNLKGQKVKTLCNTNLNSGDHQYVWNGTDEQGKKAGSGVYFYKLSSGSQSSMKKMIMMK